MGQWGTGYRDSDTYLDYRREYAQPLISDLARRLPEVQEGRYRDGSFSSIGLLDLVIHELRGQLMFVYHALEAEPRHDAYLDTDQIDVMRSVADYIQQVTAQAHETGELDDRWLWHIGLDLTTVAGWLHQQERGN